MKRFAILLVISVLLPTAIFSCGKADTDLSSAESKETEKAPTVISESVFDTEASDETPADDTFSVYVFGDSIAYGYALSAPETMCYGYTACKKLESDGINVKYTNLAVSGYDTASMLSLLKRSDFSDADAVVISIGANNILGAVIAGAMPLIMNCGFDLENEFSDYISGFNDGSRLSGLIDDFSDMLEKASFEKNIASGVNLLKTDLPKILDKIRETAPDCKIIMQTVYNPYKGIVLEIPGKSKLDLSEISDGYVTELNNVIKETLEDYPDVKLFDVYALFEESEEDCVNAGMENGFNYDPHPNSNGHNLISEALYPILKSAVK